MCFEYLLSHMSSNGLVFAIIHNINVSDCSIVPPVHTLKSGFCGFVIKFHPLCSYLPFWTEFIIYFWVSLFHVLSNIHLPKCLSNSTIFISKTMSMILAAIILIFLLANSPGFIMNSLTLCDINIKISSFAPIFWM